MMTHRTTQLSYEKQTTKLLFQHLFLLQARIESQTSTDSLEIREIIQLIDEVLAMLIAHYETIED